MTALPSYSASQILNQRNQELIQRRRRLQAALGAGDRYLSQSPAERILGQLERGEYAQAIKLVNLDLSRARRSLDRLAASREAIEGLRTRLEWSARSSALKAQGLDTAETRTKLLAIYEAKGIALSDAQVLADRLLGTGGAGFPLLDHLEADSERLDVAWQRHMRRLAMDYHLLAAVRFNQLVGQGPAATDPAHGRQVAGESRTFYDAAIARMRELARTEEYGTLGQYARLALGSVSRELSDRLLPALAGAWLSRKAAADAASRRPWEGAVLDLSTEVRRALLLLAMLRSMEAKATWPLPAVREALHAAAGRALRSKLKLPDGIPIRRLLDEPDAHVDALVCVEGRLSSLTIDEEGGKAVSRMKVVGEQPADILPVELHGIKADSGGMVPGASVVLGGTWRRVTPDPADPAATARYVLMLGRFAPGQAAEKSWEDWLAWEVSRIYQAVPHGLMAEWSWEPGLDGAANPVRYKVWSRAE